MDHSGKDEDAVVFSKEDTVDANDIWDDTELIEMYNRAISETYDAVNAQTSKYQVSVSSSSKSNSQESQYPPIKWDVGDECLAPYEADELWYPAVISSIDPNDGTCEVIYDVYEEVAWVKMSDLARREDSEEPLTESCASVGDRAKKAKKASSSNQSRMNHHKDKKTRLLESCPAPPLPLFRSPIPSIAPPPLPMFKNLPAPTDDEALASMLMSWYMSGYHTGYYQALQDQKKASGRLTSKTTKKK